MSLSTIIILVVLVLNLCAIIAMIFLERKKPEIIISWLLLFSIFPIVGFVMYVLVGSGLSIKNRRMLKRKILFNESYLSYYKQQTIEEEKKLDKKAGKLLKFNQENANAVPTYNNNIKYFTDGNEKITNLIEDIKNAKHSINIEYYIFGKDAIGQSVMNELIQKAQEGVIVNLIYDSVGSLKSPRRFFRKLKKAGGHVKEFFPPLFYIRLINLKFNYRNHRKIVVIDGKIGYVGGINIRGDHCGQNPKIAPWCDAHIRVEGPAVYALQNEFLNFWQFCNKERTVTNKYVEQGYFPDIEAKGESPVQIITSGPDERGHEIKENFQKMMYLAEKEIVLQTPYFIPDEIFKNALKCTLASGVKVKLIIPGKPDKKFVYYATQSYAQEFMDMGGEVYLYDGFMHAKVMIVDGEIITIGTANADNRSFELNFEINAVIYDKNFVKSYNNTLQEIFAHSRKLEQDHYKKDSHWTKFKQLFFRLFSPLF